MRLLLAVKSRKESMDHESEHGLESMASEYKTSHKVTIKAPEEREEGGRS